MNEQNGGLGSSTPSNVPMQRKRGRPRKVDSGVQGTNIPVMPGSSNKLNSNQTIGTADVSDEGMLGKEIPCVIEGTFNAGYLINAQVAADTYLRGVVFLPERVVPVTAESDVAPQARMTERTEIPIPVPVLNPETQIHSSVSSSGQCNKQPFEAELQVPMSVDPLLPTELHSGISVSLENRSAPVVAPMSDLPKIDSSISTGGVMPEGMSKPGPESQPTSIMSGFEDDKTLKQEETLHEVDASIQTKESSADGGATKDSKKTSEPVNLVPTAENTEKELTTGQQSMPSVYKLNEFIPDEPMRSIIEINQIPVSAEHESIPSELINNTVDNFMQKQSSPETGTQEDTKTKLVVETITKVDTANSDGRPSTDIANIPDVGSNHALELSHPSILYDREPVPSESKLLSEGSDFQEMSDPQNCSSSGTVNVDANQPTEVLVTSLESEKPIGSDASLNDSGGKDGEGSLV